VWTVWSNFAAICRFSSILAHFAHKNMVLYGVETSVCVLILLAYTTCCRARATSNRRADFLWSAQPLVTAQLLWQWLKLRTGLCTEAMSWLLRVMLHIVWCLMLDQPNLDFVTGKLKYSAPIEMGRRHGWQHCGRSISIVLCSFLASYTGCASDNPIHDTYIHLYLLKNFQYPNKKQRNRAGRKGC